MRPKAYRDTSLAWLFLLVLAVAGWVVSTLARLAGDQYWYIPGWIYWAGGGSVAVVLLAAWPLRARLVAGPTGITLLGLNRQEIPWSAVRSVGYGLEGMRQVVQIHLVDGNSILLPWARPGWIEFELNRMLLGSGGGTRQSSGSTIATTWTDPMRQTARSTLGARIGVYVALGLVLAEIVASVAGSFAGRSPAREAPEYMPIRDSASMIDVSVPPAPGARYAWKRVVGPYSLFVPAVDADPSGAYILGPSRFGKERRVVLAVTKYSPQGDLLWRRPMDIGKRAPSDGVVQVDAGRVYVAMSTDSEFGFPPEDPRVLVRVLDSDGKPLWDGEYPGALASKAVGILKGNLYVPLRPVADENVQIVRFSSGGGSTVPANLQGDLLQFTLAAWVTDGGGFLYVVGSVLSTDPDDPDIGEPATTHLEQLSSADADPERWSLGRGPATGVGAAAGPDGLYLAAASRPVIVVQVDREGTLVRRFLLNGVLPGDIAADGSMLYQAAPASLSTEPGLVVREIDVDGRVLRSATLPPVQASTTWDFAVSKGRVYVAAIAPDGGPTYVGVVDWSGPGDR